MYQNNEFYSIKSYSENIIPCLMRFSKNHLNFVNSNN